MSDNTLEMWRDLGCPFPEAYLELELGESPADKREWDAIKRCMSRVNREWEIALRKGDCARLEKLHDVDQEICGWSIDAYTKAHMKDEIGDRADASA